MLASDLIMDVRASRQITADQVAQLECALFCGGTPKREELDILYLIARYLERPDRRFAALLARATATTPQAKRRVAGPRHAARAA